jgi:hypothetical protein
MKYIFDYKAVHYNDVSGDIVDVVLDDDDDDDGIGIAVAVTFLSLSPFEFQRFVLFTVNIS